VPSSGVQPLVCHVCGVVFPPGRRASDENYAQAAVKVGWTIGYPHYRAYCPDHEPG
jgi:hypothetical protein